MSGDNWNDREETESSGGFSEEEQAKSFVDRLAGIGLEDETETQFNRRLAEVLVQVFQNVECSSHKKNERMNENGEGGRKKETGLVRVRV